MGIAAMLLILAALAGGSGSSTPDVPSSTPPTPGESVAPAELDAMLSVAGLPMVWRRFLLCVAWSESRLNPLAVNDSTDEAEDALAGYLRVVDRLVGCSWPAAAYTFGSGGLYGFLPSTAVFQLGEPYSPCIDPRVALFEPRVATAVAVGYARGLMGWAGFRRSPSWANLLVGWNRPGGMGDESAISRRVTSLDERSREMGFATGWARQQPPSLTIRARDVLANLGVT